MAMQYEGKIVVPVPTDARDGWVYPLMVDGTEADGLLMPVWDGSRWVWDGITPAATPVQEA